MAELMLNVSVITVNYIVKKYQFGQTNKNFVYVFERVKTKSTKDYKQVNEQRYILMYVCIHIYIYIFIYMCT